MFEVAVTSLAEFALPTVINTLNYLLPVANNIATTKPYLTIYNTSFRMSTPRLFCWHNRL